MVSVTLSVPDEVKRSMGRFPEINWSGFIRKCIVEKTEQLSWKEQMLQKVKGEETRTAWALDMQRTARKGRGKALREQGLI